ncbi:MAG TPA: adenylate/guanylate cyclase domain-containing protein [Bradyrhizobium sp.]|nr:adenylate/guanylate cyclase domain-containing protein [Bradyrhizobium sp.]
MAEERVQRRLAAILAADVVGYSRLIEQDEAGTLTALKDRRKRVLTPLVSEHEGRIVKVMGDGVLVEFASAVNAVACAVELQKCTAIANNGLADDRRIVLRVGINLGDVVVEGGDIYGDGVIIAVRLQAMAEPGGICISGSVHEQVGNKLQLAFDDLGPCEVKNIAKLVRALRVKVDRSEPEQPAARPAQAKPSIAVLPFDNMSGNPEQQYFSDGVTEDIITELSRFHELSVLARNTSFQFRDKTVDVRRLGRELGVQYVVEGSVRRMGERMRITAQLIDAASGNHLWAERFDRDQQEIFAVQDQVVRTIVATLVGRLEAAGAEQAGRKPPTSLAAYECVLRGVAIPYGNLDNEAERRRMFEKAIALDPGYGRPHALLAHAMFLEWFRDTSGSDAMLDRAFGLAKKAVALDENDSTCQFVLGWIHLFRRSFDLAEQYYQRALELNPNNPEQVARMGFLHVFMGRPEAAIEWLMQAKLLDPYFNPISYCHALGTAYFVAQKYDDAITAFSRSSTMPVWVQAYLAASHALTGKIDLAGKFAAEVLRLTPDFSCARLTSKEPYKRPSDRELLLDGLRKAGLPE